MGACSSNTKQGVNQNAQNSQKKSQTNMKSSQLYSIPMHLQTQLMKINDPTTLVEFLSSDQLYQLLKQKNVDVHFILIKIFQMDQSKYTSKMILNMTKLLYYKYQMKDEQQIQQLYAQPEHINQIASSFRYIFHDKLLDYDRLDEQQINKSLTLRSLWTLTLIYNIFNQYKKAKQQNLQDISEDDKWWANQENRGELLYFDSMIQDLTRKIQFEMDLQLKLSQRLTFSNDASVKIEEISEQKLQNFTQREVNDLFDKAVENYMFEIEQMKYLSENINEEEAIEFESKTPVHNIEKGAVQKQKKEPKWSNLQIQTDC